MSVNIEKYLRNIHTPNGEFTHIWIVGGLVLCLQTN